MVCATSQSFHIVLLNILDNRIKTKNGTTKYTVIWFRKKYQYIRIRYNLESEIIVEYLDFYSFVERRNKECKLHILFYIDLFDEYK